MPSRPPPCDGDGLGSRPESGGRQRRPKRALTPGWHRATTKRAQSPISVRVEPPATPCGWRGCRPLVPARPQCGAQVGAAISITVASRSSGRSTPASGRRAIPATVPPVTRSDRRCDGRADDPQQRCPGVRAAPSASPRGGQCATAVIADSPSMRRSTPLLVCPSRSKTMFAWILIQAARRRTSAVARTGWPNLWSIAQRRWRGGFAWIRGHGHAVGCVEVAL